MIEGKELWVGGKVVVMKTEGDFDAFEAIVVKIAVTRKSALVVRLERADELIKEHGATWAHMVLTAEEGNDIFRASVDEMYPAKGEAAKFLQEFSAMAETRNELTAKMKQLADRYGFHVTKKEHEEKLDKKKGKKSKKQTHEAVTENA